MVTNLVVYNHGKDSIPWGEKALALAEVAKGRGFEFISPDYQASNDPDWRVEQLLALDLRGYERIVLAGSSMGAYVATVAAETIKPQGLFLIAPAFYLPVMPATASPPVPKTSRYFTAGKTTWCRPKTPGAFAASIAPACTCWTRTTVYSAFCR